MLYESDFSRNMMPPPQDSHHDNLHLHKVKSTAQASPVSHVASEANGASTGQDSELT